MTKAQIIARAAEISAEYAEFAAEQRACGYEVISFQEFIGGHNPKDDAIEREQARWDTDTHDIY